MIKKSLKYFLIAIVNVVVLTILLCIWTDDLALKLNNNLRFFEFFKILAFTAVCLVGMSGLVFYFRKAKNYSVKIKVRTVIISTALISSYLYVSYFGKIVNNVIMERGFRNQLGNKIEYILPNGTKASKLTNKEYKEVVKATWFPKLPAEATNIDYSYDYDGFLPDYAFSLSYDLPKEMMVDTMHYENLDFFKYRTVEIKNNLKRVFYFEALH